MTAKNREGKKGYVLVTLVFVLVALLGFAALAVDVGILYGAHTSAQRAADAAALAGAFTFITSPGASDPIGLATARAMDTATENQVLTEVVQSGEVTIDVDYPNRMVTVDITHPVDTFFAKALFMNLANVHAQGIAEAALNPTGGKCVKPWFLPNSVFAPYEPCDACESHTDEFLIMPDTNVVNPVLFPQDSAGMRGTEFTMKPGNPQNALAPGQFFCVELSGPGGDDYRDDIASCPDAAEVFCLNSYSVITGNMIGPTKQGVEDLITKGGTVIPDKLDSFIENTPVFERQLNDGSTVYPDTSHQLIIAPIWDVCSTLDCVTPGAKNKLTGTNVEIPVVGFAFLFLARIDGDDVVANILDVRGCGTTPPPSTETGPFAVPLRLVRKN